MYEPVPLLSALWRSRMKLNNDEYRAAIQYMNALCRTVEITYSITEMGAPPPKLGVKRCKNRLAKNSVAPRRRFWNNCENLRGGESKYLLPVAV